MCNQICCCSLFLAILGVFPDTSLACQRYFKRSLLLIELLVGHSSLYFVFDLSKVSFISQKTTKEGFVGLDDISISAGKTVLTIFFY